MQRKALAEVPSWDALSRTVLSTRAHTRWGRVRGRSAQAAGEARRSTGGSRRSEPGRGGL